MESRIDAIYARQSIDKGDSISIESQIEYCLYEVRGAPYRAFADKGYSGKNTERPAFQKLLAAVRAGSVSRVICYRLDRISRSILDFTSLIEEFQKYDVQFVSCTEKFDTSTPMGRAMLSICIVFAQLERETIQQRICDAYRSRSRKGFYMGGRIPFGYRLEPYILDGKCTSQYAPVPQEAMILKYIFSVYAKQGTSLGDTVKALYDADLRNPRREDGAWYRSQLGKLLKNPIYVKADLAVYRYYQKKGTHILQDPDVFLGINGCYLYSDKDTQQLVLAPHEGIIESKMWLACQEKLGGTNTTSGRHTVHSWLTGILKCGKCGYAMNFRGYTRGEKTYRYFVCSRSQGADKTCEGSRKINVLSLETEIRTQLEAYLKYQNLSVPVEKEESKEAKLLYRKLFRIEKEITAITKQCANMSDIACSMMDTQLQRLYAQKKDILAQLQMSQQSSTPLPISLLFSRWSTLSTAEKHTLLSAAVKKVTVADNSVTFHWRV